MNSSIIDCVADTREHFADDEKFKWDLTLDTWSFSLFRSVIIVSCTSYFFFFFYYRCAFNNRYYGVPVHFFFFFFENLKKSPRIVKRNVWKYLWNIQSIVLYLEITFSRILRNMNYNCINIIFQLTFANFLISIYMNICSSHQIELNGFSLNVRLRGYKNLQVTRAKFKL